MKDEWCGGEIVRILWSGCGARTTYGASRIRHFPIRQGNPLCHTVPLHTYRTKYGISCVIAFNTIPHNLQHTITSSAVCTLFHEGEKLHGGVLLENSLARELSCRWLIQEFQALLWINRETRLGRFTQYSLLNWLSNREMWALGKGNAWTEVNRTTASSQEIPDEQKTTVHLHAKLVEKTLATTWSLSPIYCIWRCNYSYHAQQWEPLYNTWRQHGCYCTWWWESSCRAKTNSRWTTTPPATKSRCISSCDTCRRSYQVYHKQKPQRSWLSFAKYNVWNREDRCRRSFLNLEELPNFKRQPGNQSLLPWDSVSMRVVYLWKLSTHML